MVLGLLFSSIAWAQEARWKALYNQTVDLFQKGKYREAIPVAKEALKVAEQTFGHDHYKVATSLNNLAALYQALGQGQSAKAEPLFKRALEINEKALGPTHPDVATNLNDLGVLRLDLGQSSEAESLLKRALEIREKAFGRDHTSVAESLNNLALAYSSQGQYTKAEPLFRRAIEIYEKSRGPDHPDTSISVNNLANILFKQGRYIEAENLFNRSLTVYRKLGNQVGEAAILYKLGMVYQSQGQLNKTLEFLEEAKENYERAGRKDEAEKIAAKIKTAWAYVGEYIFNKWKTHYFEIDGEKDQPKDLLGRILEVREATGSLNVRQDMSDSAGQIAKGIDTLKTGSKVKVLDVKPWDDTGYIWARVLYVTK